MRKLIVPLTLLFALTLINSALHAQVSKEEEKFWQEKAKMYKKRPLSLKAEFENYQNQIKDLKKRNKELMQRRGDSQAENEALIDSLRWALIQAEGELQAQRKKYDKMEAAFASTKTVGEMGIRTGLVYRIQIGAFVFYEVENKPEQGADFYEEKSDGFNKYVIGGFRTIEEANVFKDEVQKMGVKDAWVVPYIDGIRVTMTEAEQYEQNQASSYMLGN